MNTLKQSHPKSKISKAIGVLEKLNNCLPRSSFVKPHLDYGDEIFDKAYIHSFQQRLESCQYKASLTVLSAIKGSSPENFYQELGLESLQSRQAFWKPCVFYKIVKEQSPKYLFDLIPLNSNSY